MQIIGSFPVVTRNTRGVVYQEGIENSTERYGFDASVSGHSTVVPGGLAEWSKIPEVSAQLAEFGITGEFSTKPDPVSGWLDGDRAFAHMRRHEGKSGKSMVREHWELLVKLGLVGVEPGAGDGDGATGDTYPGKPSVSVVLARLQEFGLITAATPLRGPLPAQYPFVERYYANKLTPENDAAFLAENFGRRPLPEMWVVREDGVALFRETERKIALWALNGAAQPDVLAAYDAMEPAFVPAIGQSSGASPSFGDRVCNPRSVIYAGRFVRDAIVRGNPSAAALHCPRLSMYLGQPQVSSRYEMWGFSAVTELQEREWRLALGLSPIGPGETGESGGLWMHGR